VKSSAKTSGDAELSYTKLSKRQHAVVVPLAAVPDAHTLGITGYPAANSRPARSIDGGQMPPVFEFTDGACSTRFRQSEAKPR
jgi:hypothetical protein